MQQWIEQTATLVTPIQPDNPVGEDPRYSDTFSDLKSEIEKKSDVDFERIRALSEQILSEQAKDIRVASYLMLSMARQDGFEGLARGMTLLLQLIQTYGEDIHPSRSKAKQSALRWFQQEKILNFAQKATNSVSGEIAEQAAAVYDALFSALSESAGEPMSWPELYKWIQSQQPKKQPEPEPTKPQSSGDQPQEPATASQTSAPLPKGAIQSTTQYQQSVRQLMGYYREQGSYEKQIALACTVQWIGLTLPPNEDGKTRLPAPRATSLTRIQNAIDNQQWEEGLVAAIDAFMEPSGNFLFDIMKQAADCAQQMNQAAINQLILSQLLLLTKKFPKLLQLRFDNDEPFASAKVTAWLEQNQQSGTQTGQAADRLSEWLQEARALAESDSLSVALVWLSEQATSSQLERIQNDFCKAQLCVEQDRSNLATPLLLQLVKDVDRFHLAGTAPQTAMQIWRTLYRLLKEQLTSIEQDDQRLDMESQIERLRSLMCTTDVASAIQWL